MLAVTDAEARRRYDIWIPALLVVTLLAVGIRLRSRDLDDKSIDVQSLFYFADLLTLIVYQFWFLLKIKELRLSPSATCFLFFILDAFVSCVNSPTPMFSIFIAATWLIVFMFVCMTQAVFQFAKLMRIYIWTAFWVCIASVIVYFVNPEIGRYATWEDGGVTLGARLSGILGHPQTMGIFAASALLCLSLFDVIVAKYKILVATVLVIGLLLSGSRTAISVFSLCLLLSRAARSPGWRLVILVVGALMSVVYISGFSLSSHSISRTDDPDEISSLTGRSEIWPRVIRLWLQQPLVGWGPGSLQTLLPTGDTSAGGAAPHAHNAALEALSTQGLIGFVLFMLTIGCAAFQSDPDRNKKLLLLLFMMCCGLTEPEPIEGRADLSFVFFALIVGGAFVPPKRDLALAPI